jgi:hypothetical protein
VKLSHKFLAHASDIQSRKGMEYTGVLLKDIEVVQKQWQISRLRLIYA